MWTPGEDAWGEQWWAQRVRPSYDLPVVPTSLHYYKLSRIRGTVYHYPAKVDPAWKDNCKRIRRPKSEFVSAGHMVDCIGDYTQTRARDIIEAYACRAGIFKNKTEPVVVSIHSRIFLQGPKTRCRVCQRECKHDAVRGQWYPRACGCGLIEWPSRRKAAYTSSENQGRECGQHSIHRLEGSKKGRLGSTLTLPTTAENPSRAAAGVSCCPIRCVRGRRPCRWGRSGSRASRRGRPC